MTRVVAAVIEKKRKYLACKRPGNKRHGGLWEFPGGKVRENETDIEAVRRELAEELNVHVIEVGATLFKVPDPGSEFLIVFKSVRIIGEPQAAGTRSPFLGHAPGIDELPPGPQRRDVCAALLAQELNGPQLLCLWID